MRSLSRSGAAAGVGIGTVCSLAGWSWAVLMITLFVTASALSRYQQQSKERRTAGMIAKGGERDALQVLANGGLFTAAALSYLIAPSASTMTFAAGAIATSAADTWATEVGTLAGARPRMITNFAPAEPGTSGAITLRGTAAAFAGALCIAFVALAVGWPVNAGCAAVLGGFAGATFDSVAGATLQRRNWCGRCERMTEREVHSCGSRTAHAGGLRWMNNDAVNAVSSAAGGITGLVCLLAS